MFTMYAREDGNTLAYPDKEEFAGIPNYLFNDSALRKRGYKPLVGEHEERDGYAAVPYIWHVVEERSYREEMRQAFDDPKKMEPTFVIVDNSYIVVDAWEYQKEEPHEQDETAFNHACEMFRSVCAQIGEFIGEEDFRGGFEDYEKFINSSAARSSKASASLLASMWNGANEFAKYEGAKLGYGQPEWWYECWRRADESSSSEM